MPAPQFVGGENQVEKKGRGREEGIREEMERMKKGKGMEGKEKTKGKGRGKGKGKWKEIK